MHIGSSLPMKRILESAIRSYDLIAGSLVSRGEVCPKIPANKRA